MFEQEDPLPRAELWLPIHDRNAELGGGQRAAQVRGHVIRSFVVMLVVRPFGREPFEIAFEVAPRSRRGIFLDDQRGGGVPAEYGEKTGSNPARRDPVAHVFGEFMQARPTRANRQDCAGLAKHPGPLAALRVRNQQRFWPRWRTMKSAHHKGQALY